MSDVGSRTRQFLTALTPLGRGVLLVALLSVVVAGELSWREFQQLGIVGLALVALALIWVMLPGSAETTLVVEPRRLTEGGLDAGGVLTVGTASVPLMAPRVEIPVGRHSLVVQLPFVAPFNKRTEEITLPSLRRGVYQVGPVRHTKRDPLGIASRDIVEGEATEVLVAPQIVHLSMFAGGMVSDLDGSTSQELSMSDLAFHALREYVPGDDLRHVHWRSSAKANTLLVRQYHETRRGHITVLIDSEPSSYRDAEDFELAVSAGTSLVVRAARDDVDTYFLCGAHQASGRNVIGVLDASCRFELDGYDFHTAISEAVGQVSATGLVILVTGSLRGTPELYGAARRFSKSTQAWVLRTGAELTPQRVERGSMTEISVPDRSHLPALITGAMR